jgi:hypothetical protein
MSGTADLLRVLRKRRFGMLLSIVTGLMVSLTVALARAALFLVPGGVARNKSAHRFPYGHVYAAEAQSLNLHGPPKDVTDHFGSIEDCSHSPACLSQLSHSGRVRADARLDCQRLLPLTLICGAN